MKWEIHKQKIYPKIKNPFDNKIKFSLIKNKATKKTKQKIYKNKFTKISLMRRLLIACRPDTSGFIANSTEDFMKSLTVNVTIQSSNIYMITKHHIVTP